MVKDAEKYADDDQAHRDRVAAKNGLEGYCYTMKNSLEGDMKDKLSGDDKKTIEDTITETLKWLDDNGSAEKGDFDHMREKIEGICNPIMTKPTGGDGEGDVDGKGPTVAEVD